MKALNAFICYGLLLLTLNTASNATIHWYASENPHNITSDYTVPANDSLIIHEGVQVIFLGHYRFNVNGTLIAIGTRADTIFFTASDTVNGWYGMHFNTATGNCELTYCVLRYGKKLDAYLFESGGAIACINSTITLDNCLIEKNVAMNSGGGIYANNNSVLNISKCTFMKNSGLNTNNTAGGGGLVVSYCNTQITDSRFTYNKSNYGGGIQIGGGFTTIVNCEISCDTALGNIEYQIGGAGAGIHFGSGGSGELELINCDITGNKCVGVVQNTGGGIFIEAGTTLNAKNCIIWGNSPDQLDYSMYGPSTVSISWSDVQGGFPDSTNIQSAPLFITTSFGNYFLQQQPCQLLPQSPCVDSGDPASQMIAGTTRTDGMQDFGIVDIGFHYPLNQFFKVILSPIDPPIVIPAAGGSFSFNTTINNSSDTVQTFDIWVMVQLPDQSWYGPVLGPLPLTLSSATSLTRLRNQYVPAAAPAGSYWYLGRIGDYPEATWDSSGFAFTKLETMGDTHLLSCKESWWNSGESFMDESITIRKSQAAPHPLQILSPNPFNPSTTLSYELQAVSRVILRVYDASGRLVATLADAQQSAGTHSAIFDGSNLPSGLYFARLQVGDYTATQKLILLK